MKNNLRKRLAILRTELSPVKRKEKDNAIAQKIESLKAFQTSRNVLFYYSVKGEVDTLNLIQRYLGKKTIYLPVIRNDEEFHAIELHDFQELKKGLKGIPEPTGKNEAKSLDLILIPGVAFDPQGHRIGTGKGYYDRFLKRYSDALKVGLAYREQIVENCPQDPYDVAMDLIVTDERLYLINQPSP
ncbi:MAG: 5-formyltetrahydrofolate cyclo-ligase [Candidatus Peregrinibacteria bacterium]